MLNIKNRLAQINWGNYTHPCGFNSQEIPELIIKLYDHDKNVSLEASERLWNVVGHQANVGSNSVPTLPFLIEAIETVEPEVKIEILEIISFFSSYSKAIVSKEYDCKEDMNWASKLYDALLSNQSLFEDYTKSEHEDIATYASNILEDLKRKKKTT